MKGWDYVPWLFLVFALVVCYGCVEHFARFEDTSQRKRTDELVNSSYAQQTNHSIPDKVFGGPIPGEPTPFRVNMYDAYL
jgi:hypothetical protein